MLPARGKFCNLNKKIPYRFSFEIWSKIFFSVWYLFLFNFGEKLLKLDHNFKSCHNFATTKPLNRTATAQSWSFLIGSGKIVRLRLHNTANILFFVVVGVTSVPNVITSPVWCRPSRRPRKCRAGPGHAATVHHQTRTRAGTSSSQHHHSSSWHL